MIWCKIWCLAGFQQNYFAEKVICVASVWYFLGVVSLLGKALPHCDLTKISPWLKVLPVGRFLLHKENLSIVKRVASDTTCKRENSFQNYKQPYHGKMYFNQLQTRNTGDKNQINLKIRINLKIKTWLLFKICFLWITWMNIQIILIKFSKGYLPYKTRFYNKMVAH